MTHMMAKCKYGLASYTVGSRNRAFACLFLYLLQPSFILRQDKVTRSQRLYVSVAVNVR